MKRFSPALATAAALLLAAGPSDGTTLLALVDTGELYASNDQGATWAVRASLPVSDASGLIAGSSPSVLYLASRTGTVYRSADAGATWSATGSVTASDVADLTGLPSGDLVALTRTGTVFASGDLGASWMGRGTLPASNLASMTLGANGGLYVLAETGEVSRSADEGVTWSTVGVIAVPDAVEIRRRDTDLVVLTGTGLTYVSSDHGATWSAVGTVSQVGMTGLAALGGGLAAVSREGLVARSASGAAWNWVGSVNQLSVVALANDDPTTTGITGSPAPVRLVLAPPRPNPLSLAAGSSLEVGFDLPRADAVSLALYDVAGRQVASRPPERFPEPGGHAVSWSLSGLGSGIYFLQLTTESGLAAASRITLFR